MTIHKVRLFYTHARRCDKFIQIDTIRNWKLYGSDVKLDGLSPIIERWTDSVIANIKCMIKEDENLK